MEKQNFLLLGILALFILPLMSAAVAEVTPITGYNYTGTVLVNCSYVNGTDELTNPTNANSDWWANSSGTWAKLSVSGFDCSATACWATADISSLTDSVYTAFNCSLGNASAVNVSSGAPVQLITFDSTDPSVSLIVQSSGSNIHNGNVVDYQCGTSDGIDTSPTNTFSVAHPSGDSVTSTSFTANLGKLTFTDTDYKGDYVFTCTSTDYTGNSASSSATVTVNELGNIVGIKKGSSGINTTTLILLAVVGIVLYFAFKKQ